MKNLSPESLLLRSFGVQTTILKLLPGELDLNFFVRASDKTSFILKVSHVGESRSELDMQNQAMLHLKDHPCELTLPCVLPNLEGEYISSIKDEAGNERFVRLLTWVEGKVWAKVTPHTPELIYHLGKSCGSLLTALKDFDHEAAHRWYKWDLANVLWIEPYLPLFRQPEQREILDYFLNLYKTRVLPVLSDLRESVNHNDANDYNILVSETHPAEVISLIDFGDMVFTKSVYEPAITAAYAMMDKPDPISVIADLIKGVNEKFPLTESEISVLFPLVAARLLITVTNAALSRKDHPENAYLLISEKPAWELLAKLRHISPNLITYILREACGFEPVSDASHFRQWIENQTFAPVVSAKLSSENIHVFDFHAGSTELGNNHTFESADLFDRHLQRLLEDVGKPIGIGRYNETRPFYTTDSYLSLGNEGPVWRTVHLGIDIFLPPGEPVKAVWPGRVHSFRDNLAERDYGPTLILEHRPQDGPVFFTLYGHLSRESMKNWEVGRVVTAGEVVGQIGPRPENGNWPPHLHFQVMLDLLGYEGDFPGVVFPHQQEVWKSLCPDPSVLLGLNMSPKAELSTEALLASRSKNLGKSLSVSYDLPLKIVRGYKQYLYDHEGRRYLDTVNNVPHVGHQHPRIVAAAQRQTAVLNTNTRYLHEEIARYAEEVLATLPPSLEVVHFVNSGSEANELAMRMAKAWRGNRDMIVVEVGYHGNTNACVDISSYKFDGKGGKGAPDGVHVMPIPDSYRGLYRGKDTGLNYAEHVEGILRRMAEAGKKPAGFICESILSCGGQIVLPEGYLKEVYEKVRNAGGICIADEVQVGFGRVGEKFWAFELQGVVPDIVTMGKPIGNGHPLGAVVCTRAVAEAFANGMEYFNTFGGNPVSCSIGREVLAVIREENLQQQAHEVGKNLYDGLLELQSRHPVIGDVRGIGFFQGFELVKDRDLLTPAAEQAGHLANRMRRMGILMSTDGPYHNVLKIKPPMCFSRENVVFLCETLDRVLKEDYFTLG
ncbi:MAG: aminotransferase class III-fold pyridoxal phosphate-dependent enzyme [Bacteroidia bacterium]|nr:aminotransferase class III-fold pyridoxal phosphate-dependent enzyme [Bacteroidia bacterium]